MLTLPALMVPPVTFNAPSAVVLPTAPSVTLPAVVALVLMVSVRPAALPSIATPLPASAPELVLPDVLMMTLLLSVTPPEPLQSTVPEVLMFPFRPSLPVPAAVSAPIRVPVPTFPNVTLLPAPPVATERLSILRVVALTAPAKVNDALAPTALIWLVLAPPASVIAPFRVTPLDPVALRIAALPVLVSVMFSLLVTEAVPASNNKVAPAATAVAPALVPSAASLFAVRVPALTLVNPVYVFVPERIVVPASCLVRVLPAPSAITPESVNWLLPPTSPPPVPSVTVPERLPVPVLFASLPPFSVTPSAPIAWPFTSSTAPSATVVPAPVAPNAAASPAMMEP